MQTRKRAKTVTFGKKEKEKREKATVKETAEEKVVVADTDKSSAKAETVERRVVPEKTQPEELSATPPQTEEASVSEIATPTSEFVADNPLSSTDEIPKTTTNEIAAPSEETSISPASESDQVTPAEVTQPPIQAAEVQPSPTNSQELSSTLPPSAFTIQGQETETPTPKREEGSKRFGIYFFLVAFLAFILGLGAMAGASYFGLINIHFPKLSSTMHAPALLSSKPTSTPTPQPTTAPTAKPLDLTAYTISVLNGSGISGKAAQVKAQLTVDGFKVSSAGNAATSDFTKTEIAVKSTVDQAYISKLEEELKKSFIVDTTAASLPSSSSTDVTVTLGSQTAQ